MKKIISTLLLSICVCYADQNLNSNRDIPLVEDSVKVDTIIADSPKEVKTTVESLFDSVPKTNSKPQKLALASDKKNPIPIKAAEPVEAQNIIALLKEAQSALDNHADVTALELFEKACALGSANGCVTAGNIYRLGMGTERDYKKAMSLFEIAAKQDSITAMFSLGKMYYLGRGAEQDYKKAISFFEKAALKGDVNSQSYLGFIYATAPKPIRDKEKSVVWLDKAKKNKNYKSFDIEGYKVQTVGGVLKTKYEFGTKEKNKNKSGQIFLYHGEELIDEQQDFGYFGPIAKYSFGKTDLIEIHLESCGMNSCSSESYYCIVKKDGSLVRTPMMSYRDNMISNFDGEILLSSTEYEDGKRDVFMYEDGKVTLNDEPFPVFGGYPQDLVKSENWNEKFRNLLGSKYEDFERRLGLADYTKYDNIDGVVIGKGCTPHACFSQAIFTIDARLFPRQEAKIYALMTDSMGEKVSKYGFEDWGKVPKELKEWAIEHGEIVQNAEEPSIRCDVNHVDKCTNAELEEMLRAINSQ